MSLTKDHCNINTTLVFVSTNTRKVKCESVNKTLLSMARESQSFPQQGEGGQDVAQEYYVEGPLKVVQTQHHLLLTA